MTILAIDTSAVAAGAAVLKDGKIIGETYLNIGLTHSETLMSLIDSVLKLSSVSVSEVDYFAVAVGPGSFTGIRIGVSAVKGLAFTNNVKVFPISTLEALANCADIDEYLICPVMDARCHQVYTALFEKRDNSIFRLTEDKPEKLDELYDELRRYEKKVLLIGDGADIAYEYLSGKNIEVRKFSEIFKYQHASGVAITAFRNYNRGVMPVEAKSLQPVYLRLSQAERELKKREMKI